MNGIIGMGYLALQTELTPKANDYLSKITYSAESLMGILNDILDFSKIEANMLTIEQVEFSPAQLINNINTLHKNAAENKGIELKLPPPDSLPPTLIGDPLRIQQVITNLLNNAIKFTAKGAVSLDAAVRETDPIGNRANILFTVQDSGIGISPEQIQQLFLPFTQSDTSTTREYGGTGLGLSICQSLVHLMGGEISVTSTPGSGSSFSFSIWCGCDAAREAKSDLAATRDTAASGAPPGTGSQPPPRAAYPGREAFAGLRILLVDDNAINTQLAAEMLERVGATVTTAANGREAVEKVSEADGAFSLVLMDVQMPVMDGHMAAKQIRERWSSDRLPIVAMTAHAMAEERERCLDSGMNDLLTKPINPGALLNMVASITSRGSEPLPATLPPPVSEMSGLPETLPGLSVHELLSRCMGNTDMLMRVVTGFIKEGGSAADALSAAIGQADRNNVLRHVHTLKGLSGNVGATELHKVCKELEAARKSEEGSADFQHFIPLIRQQLELIADSAKTLAAITGRKERVTHAADADSAATISALRTALQNMDSTALKLTEALIAQLPASPELETLFQQVDSIDFDGALLTLDRITR